MEGFVSHLGWKFASIKLKLVEIRVHQSSGLKVKKLPTCSIDLRQALGDVLVSTVLVLLTSHGSPEYWLPIEAK